MKASNRTIGLIIAGIALVACLALSGRADAQDAAAMSMMNQTVQNAILLSTTDNGSSKPTPPPPAAPKLYRERVPGKPEEGFVPVDTPKRKASGYVTTAVRTPYGETTILDDYHRRVSCYITLWNGRIAQACVPMK